MTESMDITSHDRLALTMAILDLLVTEGDLEQGCMTKLGDADYEWEPHPQGAYYQLAGLKPWVPWNLHRTFKADDGTSIEEEDIRRVVYRKGYSEEEWKVSRDLIRKGLHRG